MFFAPSSWKTKEIQLKRGKPQILTSECEYRKMGGVPTGCSWCQPCWGADVDLVPTTCLCSSLTLLSQLPFDKLKNKWAAGWLAGWISVRPEERRYTVLLLEVVGFILQVLNQVTCFRVSSPHSISMKWKDVRKAHRQTRQLCLSFPELPHTDKHWAVFVLLLLLRSKAAVLLWIKAFWVNYSQEL